jgi:hypothetical protein
MVITFKLQAEPLQANIREVRTMVKWEYESIITYKNRNLFEKLNQLGGEGWEMCGALSDSNGDGTIFLERPLQ